MEMNRRQFVAGTAAAGVLASVAGTAATVAQADEAVVLPEGTTQEDFDNSLVELAPVTDFIDERTYDVVVVGAGTAGVPAVMTAVEEGATVACLQKESVVMANGNGSSGLIQDMSNDLGKLQYKQAWRKSGGYRINPDLLDLFVDHSGEAAMWLLARANEFGFPPVSSNVTRTEFDEGSFVSVVLSSYGPKPKNHTDIMATLADAAVAQGAEFFYETPAVQLIQDESGAVTGVVGKSADGYIKFNATKAVIIAAGDYQNNESLVHRYSPDVERFARKQFNRTADGILMSMVAGARMVPVNHAKTMHDMDATPMLMTRYPFMALNDEGKRFMNEEIPMESWDLTLQWNKNVDDPGRFFRIFDNAYQEKYGAPTKPESLEAYIPGFQEDPKGVYVGLIDTHRADTVEELAAELGIPAENLQASIDAWNEACATGADLGFGVAKSNLHPIDTPPYWGVRQWIRCSAINAGVVIDGCCRVLDANDEPIPGLYSVGSGAGNICGGLEWNLYQGGLCCGSYITMGRYAALHALTGGMEPSAPVTTADVEGFWTVK